MKLSQYRYELTLCPLEDLDSIHSLDRDFSFVHHIQAYIKGVQGALSPKLKRPKCGAYRSLSQASFKKCNDGHPADNYIILTSIFT
jgi:hypothetical protein